MKLKPYFGSLFVQVLLATLCGAFIAVLAPDVGVKLKPLSDGFIALIKMLIPLIVFCVVVQGIATAGNLKHVGRIGAKALIYFEVLTTVALLFGLVIAYLAQPGAGMNVDIKTLDSTLLATHADNSKKLLDGGFANFALAIIPKTVISAFTSGDILQVLLIGLIAGCGLSIMGEAGEPLVRVIDALAALMLKMMGFIIKLAPLGVLGAVAFTLSKYGIGSIKQLIYFVLSFYGAVLLFVFIVLGGIMRVSGLSLWKLLRYLKEELLIVCATTASDSVLPQVMKKLQNLGIKESTVGLVIPTGYSFNLDAFSIYITLAVVFIAQATNTPIGLSDLALVLFVTMMTSKGAHGIPGSAMVVLAATLTAIPSLPAVGVVLLLSADWFIGIARAVGNLIGNCVATIAIARWEGDIDVQKAQMLLEKPL